MHSQSNEDSWKVTQADAFNVLYSVAVVLSTSVAVLMRRRFGCEALAWNSLLAFITLFACACLIDPVFLVLLIIFSVAQVFHRIETFRASSRGEVIHSYFAGHPVLAMKLRGIKSEEVARMLGEPMICAVIGLLLYPLTHGLGVYLMICGLALIVRHGLDEAVTRKRIRRMRDASLEQRYYSDRMRN